MAYTKITMKRGEQKTLSFTVRDNCGKILPLTGSTLAFEVEDPDTQITVIAKVDGDFDKTQEAGGIVSVSITSVDSDITPKDYNSELKISFAGGDIDKSITFPFSIEYAINA